MDLLREAPEREVRRRFREEMSPSSKGFGRVEQGSEETARSLDSTLLAAGGSIWLLQVVDDGNGTVARRKSYLRSAELGGSCQDAQDLASVYPYWK